MAGIRLTVKKLDGLEHTYTITPSVIVAFERQYKTGLSDASNKAEHLYWMAYEAERRDALARGDGTVPNFDKWLDTVESVERPAGDEDPTEGQPSS